MFLNAVHNQLYSTFLITFLLTALKSSQISAFYNLKVLDYSLVTDSLHTVKSNSLQKLTK